MLVDDDVVFISRLSDRSHDMYASLVCIFDGIAHQIVQHLSDAEVITSEYFPQILSLSAFWNSQEIANPFFPPVF